MGESTCVMHAFSYPSSISNEAQEDNPIYALEESVSLGRFMTETLSWEKWSSFSRNRYVEEAEMYSRPGSVKQKKAYFEAHFKRMAALKAAALLEQANSTQRGGGAPAPDPDPPKLESQVYNNDVIKIDDGDADHYVKDDLVPDSPPSILDQQWIEKEDENSDDVPNYNENESNDEVFEETDQAEHNEDESNDEVVEEADLADHDEDELKECFMDVEEQNPSTDMESDLAKEHESCLEEEVFHECVVEKEAEDSGSVADHNEDDPDEVKEEPSMANVIEEKEQATQVQSTEKHFMDDEKQNTSTEMESSLVKKDESRIECSSVNQDTTPPTTSPRSNPNPPSSALIQSTPIGQRSPKLSSYMPSVEGETTVKSVAQQPAAVHPGKENTLTPIGRKSWINDPEKKRTPLRMSINRELNRLISPVIKKIGSSSKTSNKDCSTPLKTPAKASVDGMRNDPPETPQSGRRRARELFDSSGCSGSKPAGSRWQFLSAEGSKSPAGGKNKTSSPIIPKSFCLNGGNRVPRRKESLQERFNTKATESTQQQSKLKEKPNELTKLRHSFCFGAKLSSESFRERKEQTEVQTEKDKGADCKLPKNGKSRLQNMTSLPPRKPVPKGTKNVKSQKKGEFASSNASTE